MLLNCGVGEDSWESLGLQGDPTSSKGDQSWMFIERTEAEAPKLWPPDAKNWLIGNDPDAGKDRRQEEKGMTEDEMVGWHHPVHGHEFEQVLGVSDGQGSLACCSHVWLFVTPWTAACRLSCPSLSPGVCSNSCALSRWCYLTISSCVVPFSSCLLWFLASGSFPMSWVFPSGGQSIRASASVY